MEHKLLMKVEILKMEIQQYLAMKQILVCYMQNGNMITLVQKDKWNILEK